jgi:hypothetical protein
MSDLDLAFHSTPTDSSEIRSEQKRLRANGNGNGNERSQFPSASLPYYASSIIFCGL